MNDTILWQWFLNSAHDFKTEIVEYTWTSSLSVKYYDISVFLNIADTTFEGRSSGSEYRRTAIKALMEGVERWAFKESKLKSTSNGFAAHFSLERAKKHSIEELLERDLFLAHFYTQTPFRRIDKFEKHMNSSLLGKIFKLTNSQFSFECYEMSSVGCYRGVVGLANIGRGIVISLGISEKLPDAIESAFDCLLRKISPCIEGKYIEVITLEDFSKIEKVTPFHHLALGLNMEYAKKFRETYLSPEISRIHNEAMPPIDTNFNFDQYCERIKFPGAIALATSSDVQDLTFGLPNEGILNKKRLDRFSPQTTYNLSMPHPFS